MHIPQAKWRLAVSTVFGVAALGIAGAAYADPPGHEQAEHHPLQAVGHDGAHPGPNEHADHDGHPDHAGNPDHPNAGLHLGWEKETPEQRATRVASRHALELKIWQTVHKDDKPVTEEERELIKAQWRRHARLWKIRELAEAAKDTATVQQCEKLLTQSDDWLVKKLQEMNAKAAPAGGAK